MGALTEHHKCPRGPLIRLFDGLSTVVVGGVVGAFLCFELVDRPVPALVLAAAALGGVLASAVRQAVSGGR